MINLKIAASSLGQRTESAATNPFWKWGVLRNPPPNSFRMQTCRKRWKDMSIKSVKVKLWKSTRVLFCYLKRLKGIRWGWDGASVIRMLFVLWICTFVLYLRTLNGSVCTRIEPVFRERRSIMFFFFFAFLFLNGKSVLFSKQEWNVQ